MESEDRITERWQELRDAEILVADGVDEEGEVVYLIDQEALLEFDPELYKVYIDDLDLYLAAQISSGMMGLEVGEDGHIQYVPNEDWSEI